VHLSGLPAKAVTRAYHPVAEKAKPRKISAGRGDGHTAINDSAPKREFIDP
jgi:HSP20 family protein